MRATVEGRGTIGPHETELVVELARDRDAVAVWLYLGDGWTGFSLSPHAAERVSDALRSTLDARKPA